MPPEIENIEAENDVNTPTEEVADAADSVEETQEAGDESTGDFAEDLKKQITGDNKKPSASEAAKQQQKIKEEIRKFKLKVDGREEEVDEKELLKRASLGSAAQKRMQEAAQLRKDVEQLVELLRSNPLAVLSDPALGVDMRKIFEEYANKELEEAGKSEEQKEKERLQKELEDLRKQAQKEKEAREKAEFERLKEKAQLDLDNQMNSALENAGLPRNPYVIKRMADYMMIALQNDKKLSPADIVPIVKREFEEDFKQFISVSPDEVVEQLLTKERISNLRKKAITAAKKPIETVNSIKSTGVSSSKDVQDKKSDAKKQTISSWLRS